MTETLIAPVRTSTYVTQHCVAGNCEGTKNKSKTGASFHACRGKYSYRGGSLVVECSHKCHEDMRKLRELAGLPEPDYTQSFAVPSSSLAGLAHTVREPAEGTDDGDTGTDVRAALGRTSKPTFDQPTESGRLQRGQLEQRVYNICKMGPNQNVKTICTFIGMQFPGEEPSAGAVTAVLRRWEASGLATIAENPLRCVEFSDHVKAVGLWDAKAAIDRKRDRAAKGHW